MSGTEWRAVKEQVEVIATEVVEWDRTWDVIYSLHQRELLTQGHVAHLRVGEGEDKGRLREWRGAGDGNEG